MNRFDTTKPIQRSVLGAIAAATLLGLDGCSGMSTQDRNTAIGGAAVGGTIGHEVSDDE